MRIPSIPRLPRISFPAIPWISPQRHRRRWTGDGHVHLELRAVPLDRWPEYVDAVERRLNARDDVQWAHVIAATRRVVIACADLLAGDTESNDPIGDLIDELTDTEDELELTDHPFPLDAADHPADIEPIVRDAIAIGGDVVGFGLGVFRVRRGIRLLPIEIDVAALFSVFEGVPSVRHAIERRVGAPAADVGLALLNAFVQGFAQGPMSPVVDIAWRTSVLTELVARRRAWERHAVDLCAYERASDDRHVPADVGVRPVPIPHGPVETYSDAAWVGSLAGFTAAFAFTRRFDRATAAIQAGLPKAARLGREAYAAHVARVLSARDALVIDANALRRLDRIDTLIIDGHALTEHGELRAGALEIIERARQRDLEVIIATPSHAAPAELVSPEQHITPTDAAILVAIRQRQAAGGTVMLVAHTHRRVFGAADFALGVHEHHEPPAWGAHVLVGRDLGNVLTVLHACELARRASTDSVKIAGLGAGTGAVVAFGGVVPGTAMRAATAVNVAALMAIANGTRLGIELEHRPRPDHHVEPPWHALDPPEVLERVGSSIDGLDPETAAARVTPIPAPSPWPITFARAVGRELANPLTPVLAAGAGLSALTGSPGDAVMVSSVLGVNALIGGVQRLRTDTSLARLVRRQPQLVITRRGGEEHVLDATALVAGDIVRLRSGDVVPADCRIIGDGHVEVDESSLTGESVPVAKHAKAVARDAHLADRTSMLYDGSAIASGEAIALVVATDNNTQASRAVLLAGPPPETGIEQRLRSITALTIPVSIVSGALVVGSGLLHGRALRSVVGAGVSLAVASVPEGLPLLATVAQLGASRRLAQRNALVRNPRAVEALGRINVLCADKTGTLTAGAIAVHAVSDGQTTWAIEQLGKDARAILASALRAGPRAPRARALPHPTDRALHDAATHAGVDRRRGAKGWHRRHELPFEPARGYHAVLGTTNTGTRLSVKGAPEIVLPRCTSMQRADNPLDAATRHTLSARVEEFARRGLRVLCVAERRGLDDQRLRDHDVSDLTFVGFIVLSDPVRPAAAQSIERLQRAGVQVIMITGDHPSTAESIGIELGLLDHGTVLTGTQIDALEDAELATALQNTRVCARVSPAHKVRIVRALQLDGRVVGMTGDGANDAPAIRLADAGIALGLRSTTAAQDAADVVVTDDHIETIVDAVIEGRAMWTSVRDAVALLLGGNLGEIGFTVAGSIVTGRSPLNTRQLLLVNLLTDALPAMAIALRPPQSRSPEQLAHEGPDAALGIPLRDAILWRGVTTAAGAGLAYSVARLTGTPGRASTVGLIALVGTQLGQTLALGRRDPIVLATGIGSTAAMLAIVETPGVSQLFGCRPVGPVGVATGIGSAALATTVSTVAPHLLRVATGRETPAP